jgi:Transposase domain (DUF772)
VPLFGLYPAGLTGALPRCSPPLSAQARPRRTPLVDTPFRTIGHRYARKRPDCCWRRGRGGMSLEPRSDEGAPEMTARVGPGRVPEGDAGRPYPGCARASVRGRGLRRRVSRSGRPAASRGALALVAVLQLAEGLSDRQAADQVRARMDWKFFLGLELDNPGFDFTVLGDFRSRLARPADRRELGGPLRRKDRRLSLPQGRRPRERWAGQVSRDGTAGQSARPT